jgi:8-oxo-dGTP pyrophosphatase MutT (NUDIX family)
MIGADIVAAIRARLTAELAPPRRGLRPWRIDGQTAGWLDERRLARALEFSGVFRASEGGLAFAADVADFTARTRALEGVARALAAEGALSPWRDERYAIAAELGAPPWCELERAAARYFGIRTFAAHVNGVVRDAGATTMWFARRSPAKAIDPGLLDNLVGGGVAAGSTVAATVVKEAWEEAGIGTEVAVQAVPAGIVEICRSRPDGLQRETIFVHDLWLDAGFEPSGHDGEVVAWRRVDVAHAAQLIANASGADVVTADASLVVLDWLLREGAIPRDSPDFRALDALRRPDVELCG